MMLPHRMLMRMTRWAQNPLSEGRVKLVLAVIAFCLALFAIEFVWGWPEWLTPNATPRGRI